MVKYVFLNKKGVGLVEVLMALVIFLMVSLALLQMALVGIESNTKNMLRDEAVSVADAQIENTRSKPFDELPTGLTNTPIDRTIRNKTYSYSAIMNTTDLSTDAKQLNLGVSWDWKGKSYEHNVMTIVRRQ